MRDKMIAALGKRLDAYAELLAHVDENQLTEKIDVPGHKSIAEHLWCVIGARESYAHGIEAGQWQGFNCSMQSFTLADFTNALTQSADRVNAAVQGVTDWTEQREQLLLDLSEHEVMHEGQLIRHFYAVEKEMPDSIRWA